MFCVNYHFYISASSGNYVACAILQRTTVGLPAGHAGRDIGSVFGLNDHYKACHETHPWQVTSEIITKGEVYGIWATLGSKSSIGLVGMKYGPVDFKGVCHS